MRAVRVLTRSEQFVHDLTRQACLRLWTYASPQGKERGKELCDTLVACPPDVIVISVKEIELDRDAENFDVAVERWKRRAIDESVSQVYGAVRRLASVENVTATDGSPGVTLGSRESRRIHRIAVAIGGEDLVPLESRDFDRGFVHVFSAETLLVVLRELDTISDLVGYLVAREELLVGGLRSSTIASEHDLLAVYLANAHSFKLLLESDHDLVILTDVWDNFVVSREYATRYEANKGSYVWDRLIEQLHEDHLTDNMEFGGDLHSIDQVTRVMARENRTQRRGLAEAFVEFMERKDLESRMVMSSSGTTSVFLKAPHAVERKYRTRELEMRAWVARDEAHKQGLNGPVVGLATEVREPGSGFSLDALLLTKPEWTEEDAALTEELRARAALFVNPVLRRESVDEFPAAK